MEKTKKEGYLAPKIELIQVTVEHGFAGSDWGGIGDAGDDLDNGTGWDF